MQNPSPVDSELKLPPPPKRVTFFSLASIAIISLFMGWCVASENWLGAGIDFVLILVQIYFAYARYSTLSGIYKQLRTLYVVKLICETPVMREEGCSIILTYLMPSPRIMEEIKKLSSEVTK